MKVFVFPADEGGCGHYRLIWPARVLAAAGHDITIVTAQQRDQMLQVRIGPSGNVASVRLPQDVDVLVFQRVTHRFLVQAIPHMRRAGVAVVIDMDDDLTCIHPANPAFTMLHPHNIINADHSWKNTLAACDAATLVTVSTPALAKRYGAKTPGVVLYNMVPQRYLDVPHIDSNVVGWAGSVHSHPTDLQVMGPSIAQLLQSGGRFKVVGPLAGVHAALGVSLERFTLETTGEIKSIEAWPLAVASLGVGVAPLADSKFNAAKSWLKMLEYAAVGVPCIASPRVEYARLYKLGVGQLAKNPNDWRVKLRRLATDGKLRADLSEAGRSVMQKYTIEKNAHLWWQAWEAAAALEREPASVAA